MKISKTLGPVKLKLEGGQTLNSANIAYETWGKLNNEKSNAILVCHALTGDQFATEINPITKRNGWWENLIGPNKILDTNKYFIICSNVLGGCMGTTGPSSINSDTGKEYAMNFPIFTIKDMVNLQLKLIDFLKIDQLFSVIGGSMGGMQVLEWAATYPERIYSAIPIATSFRHSAQNIAFHEVGRQAIMNDPNWHKGNYQTSTEKKPKHGLSVARMIAHITYLSENAMHRKFGRKLQSRDIISFGFDADFQVESYLRYQGRSFVERFDANSYLYLTRAMDYFDIVDKFSKAIEFPAIPNKHINYLVVSFTSDWLFPTIENKEIVKKLNYFNRNVSFTEIETDKGHDSFLLDELELDFTINGFLESNYRKLESNE